LLTPLLLIFELCAGVDFRLFVGVFRGLLLDVRADSVIQIVLLLIVVFLIIVVKMSLFLTLLVLLVLFESFAVRLLLGFLIRRLPRVFLDVFVFFEELKPFFVLLVRHYIILN
jgi:hypothetical protein